MGGPGEYPGASGGGAYCGATGDRPYGASAEAAGTVTGVIDGASIPVTFLKKMVQSAEVNVPQIAE
jgi:hypothetical protein